MKHASRNGERLASNNEVDNILMSGLSHLTGRSILTGTISVYQSPNTPFGERIVYEGIAFNVPQEFQKLSNAALVLESPSIKDGVIMGKNIRVVTDFPVEFGCYQIDESTGIPHGSMADTSERQARYLWRADSGIHAVVRSGGLADWRIVDTSQKPDVAQLAVFVSQGEGSIVVPKGPVAVFEAIRNAMSDGSRQRP